MPWPVATMLSALSWWAVLAHDTFGSNAGACALPPGGSRCGDCFRQTSELNLPAGWQHADGTDTWAYRFQ